MRIAKELMPSATSISEPIHSGQIGSEKISGKNGPWLPLSAIQLIYSYQDLWTNAIRKLWTKKCVPTLANCIEILNVLLNPNNYFV
jgi:hypothetical protein